MLRFRGSGHIRVAVREHLESRDDLGGKRAVDIPAGHGVISDVLSRNGANVDAYDLYPEFFQAEVLTCSKADLRATLPIADHHADLVVFQEAVEHLADPLHALRELNRILLPGGELILTTPNVSHLRAKLSHLLMESELYNRLPANELDALWFKGGDEPYYGHVFLIGIQRLRVLSRIAGFRLKTIHPVKVSLTSLLLGFLYPVVLLANLFAYRRTVRRNSQIHPDARRETYGEILRLNLHPTVLFGKHLFLSFEKVAEWNRVPLKVYKDASTIC